jgi:hypothetical protein
MHNQFKVNAVYTSEVGKKLRLTSPFYLYKLQQVEGLMVATTVLYHCH